jgi:hypothetical protein
MAKKVAIKEDLQTFDPVLYSIKENEFLLENLGKPTVVALRLIVDPKQVNPNAIRPLLERVAELEQLKVHEGLNWVGIDAMKKSIQSYLRENQKWASDHKRNKKAPRYPSLYSFDSKGRGRRGGPGSDSDRVRTYFGPAGERIPFEIQLIPENVMEWAAPGFTEQSTEKYLKVDTEAHRIECLVPVGEGICGHTESYKADSRSSYNAARARMSKHLRKATENTDDHRELHTNEFGG